MRQIAYPMSAAHTMEISRPPIQRVPAIDATKKGDAKPAMDFKRFYIACGRQSAKHITHRQGFLAVVVEPSPSDNLAEAWYVGFTYMPSGTGAPLVKVISHLHKDAIGIVGAPKSLSISAEAVLAVAMGADGVRTFILSTPVEHHRGATFAPWRHFNNLGVCSFAKWINPVRDQRALVTRSTRIDTTVNVHGNLETPKSTIVQLFRAENSTILAFDAAEPGNIALVVKCPETFILHLLILQSDGTFGQRSLNLCQPGMRRADVPTNLTPISMAVGDEQVAIGFAPVVRNAMLHERAPPGLVEAFCIDSGNLQARRLLPNSLPTALATWGTRLLIGASDCCMSFDSATGEHSAIYAMSTKGNANYTVYRGDEFNLYWQPGVLHIDKLSWCYARTQNVASETMTVVENAAVPTR